MKWISVKDRLPEKNQKGLCIQDPVLTGTREPLWFIFDGAKFLPPEIAVIYAEYQVGKSSWCNITHWMSLPDPPKVPAEDFNDVRCPHCGYGFSKEYKEGHFECMSPRCGCIWEDKTTQGDETMPPDCTEDCKKDGACGICEKYNPELKPKLNCDCFGWVENIGESPTVKIWHWVYCPWCSKELI